MMRIYLNRDVGIEPSRPSTALVRLPQQGVGSVTSTTSTQGSLLPVGAGGLIRNANTQRTSTALLGEEYPPRYDAQRFAVAVEGAFLRGEIDENEIDALVAACRREEDGTLVVESGFVPLIPLAVKATLVAAKVAPKGTPEEREAKRKRRRERAERREDKLFALFDRIGRGDDDDEEEVEEDEDLNAETVNAEEEVITPPPPGRQRVGRVGFVSQHEVEPGAAVKVNTRGGFRDLIDTDGFRARV